MKIDIGQFKTQDTVGEIKLYTLMGYEAYTDDNGYPRLSIENERVFAKAIQNKKGKSFNSEMQYRFYIRTDPNKKIYDPVVIHSTTDKNPSSFLNKICKTETVFTEVSEYIFNQYITFLKTKNQQLLVNAQRELR